MSNDFEEREIQLLVYANDHSDIVEAVTVKARVFGCLAVHREIDAETNRPSARENARWVVTDVVSGLRLPGRMALRSERAAREFARLIQDAWDWDDRGEDFVPAAVREEGSEERHGELVRRANAVDNLTMEAHTLSQQLEADPDCPDTTWVPLLFSEEAGEDDS